MTTFRAILLHLAIVTLVIVAILLGIPARGADAHFYPWPCDWIQPTPRMFKLSTGIAVSPAAVRKTTPPAGAIFFFCATSTTTNPTPLLCERTKNDGHDWTTFATGTMTGQTICIVSDPAAWTNNHIFYRLRPG